MTTWFISDIHLSPERPEVTMLFKQFLRSIKPENTLYILGDFFEYWLGDDENSALQQDIEKTLTQLHNQNVMIYFMPGNRDFLIGRNFCQQANMKLLPDPTYIHLNNQKIILMHGDSLCINDKPYMLFRKIVRNRIFQNIFLKLPLSFRRVLFQHYRQKSKKITKQKSFEIMDVDKKCVAKLMEQQKADILIHGHTHRPKIHQIDENQKRMVLGTWDNLNPKIIKYENDLFDLCDININ